MSLQDLWVELEHEAAGSSRRGILRRRVIPEADCDLFVAIDHTGTPVRMLILRVAQSVVADHGSLPEAKGCELVITRFPDDPTDRASVCLSLLDRRFADVFTSLVLDVISHLSDLSGDREVVVGLVGRIERWQRFLDRHSPEGLALESQRGLFGELWFLKTRLIPAVGAEVAVAGWTGPHRTPHDFQLPAGSVEVKTTIAKQHIKLEITSDRQLDDTRVPCLALFHLSVDSGATGVSLPDLVDEMRGVLAQQASREAFEDLLVEAGYLDTHADHYREPHYQVRSAQLFKVCEGFPRLIERDLPTGVGDLRYTVVLASCMPFSVPEAQWLPLLRGDAHE